MNGIPHAEPMGEPTKTPFTLRLKLRANGVLVGSTEVSAVSQAPLGKASTMLKLPERLCTFALAPRKQTGSLSFQLEDSQAELGNQPQRI
jgi:hypothetical protein